jgi:tetratricopeptide (TPR) repeat protein
LTHRPRKRFIAIFMLLIWVFPASQVGASVSSELAFHRGVVAFGDARFDAAALEFEKVVAEDPEDTAALQYLGLIAQEQEDFSRAVEFYDRALLVDPGDLDIQVDRASALLELGRVDEATTGLEAVLAARPDDPRANLLAGVAAYRAGKYEAAITRLDRAKSLDSALAPHATYYAGLSAAFLGNFAQAEGAFSAVEEQSPLSPLSISAKSLREQMTPTGAEEEQRPWALSITSGIEWDSNPTFAGKSNPGRPPGTPDFGNQKDDFRGVWRLLGSYQLLEIDRYTVAAGYEGYLSAHKTTDKVDLQTHVAWFSGTANYDPIRFGLRYDYAYTMIDMADKFRSLHRITPSATYREADWGVTQLYFQYQNERFLQSYPSAFNRDGDRYTVGVNQFVFLPEPFTYVRIGALGNVARTKSTDFSYDGLEVSFGVSGTLPWNIQLTTLYRFLYRDYRSINALPADYTVGRNRSRFDYVHRATIELAKPIFEHVEASVASSLDFLDSNIDAYDHNRAVVGAYLTYRF